MTPNDQMQLDAQLQQLHLHYIRTNYHPLAREAAER